MRPSRGDGRAAASLPTRRDESRRARLRSPGAPPATTSHRLPRDRNDDGTSGGDRSRDRVLLAARITYDRAPKRPGGGPWRVPVDQTLRCRECGVDFIWTEGEQEFFASRGLTNPPSRCPSCRAARRAAAGGGGGGYGGGGGGGGYRPLQRAAADVRGDLRRLRWRRARALPASRDKPVYCSDCFRPSGR